jgi:hypothetical protein
VLSEGVECEKSFSLEARPSILALLGFRYSNFDIAINSVEILEI